MNFDIIIQEAEINDINIAWSNPCIEIWFHAYLGKMPVNTESTKCVRDFKSIFNSLESYGSRKTAVTISQNRLRESKLRYSRPSEMLSTTTVFKVIDEITKSSEK